MFRLSYLSILKHKLIETVLYDAINSSKTKKPP
jgi:hypothetical protein